MPHPKGGYRNSKGERVPSVTTITGRFKEAGGLMWWAFTQGQAAERGEISGLYDKRDEAADAGTLAHSLVEAYIKGAEQPQIPDTEAGEQAMKGFHNFLNWREDNRLVIIAQEAELVSEKYQFGGCPDAIALNSRGEIVLLDWKTSSGVYVGSMLQVAAYKELWNENHPDSLITGGCHICRFDKQTADFAHRFWGDLQEAWEMFLLLRRAYDLDKKLKRRIK